ncbi:MAG: M24 family metallopeptidase [Terracoccus sp.]
MDLERWVDLPAQLERLAEVGYRHDVRTIVLRDPASLTWLLGGRVNVPQTLDSACLDVVVDLGPSGHGEPSITVVTNAIEAPRLRDTELAGLPGEWVVVPWWESRDRMLPKGAGVGSDRPAADWVDLAADLAELRRALTDRQQRQLREVCRDTAAAATAAAQLLGPTTTEYAAAGLLARELLTRRLDPIVLLVGGDDRIGPHRHPLPTGAALGRRGMLVACGRRHGLVASVTRIVSFEPLAPAARDAYRRLLEVERAFLDASIVGAGVAEVFTAGVAAYAEQGFDRDEWHRHHQGGFSGWQPREFPAHSTSAGSLFAGGVVAWNPSAAGWKVEDTTLVLDSGAEPLVHDDTWPTIVVGGRRRPDVLVP